MAIKLIALDLDGTTLNKESKLSEGNRRALQAAADKGVNIVIATGRPFCALPQEILDFEPVRYVLTSNGARITDLHEGREENRNMPIYVKRNTVIPDTTGAETEPLPSLTATTERGCTLRMQPRAIILSMTRIRMTLIDPAVEAEHPPMNMIMSRISWHTVGQNM